MADLWKELHVRALTFKGKNDEKFLTQFAKKIPKFGKGCKCKEHWIKWVKKNPPDFKNYFSWTVMGHNNINKILGKPVYTVKDAKKFYKQYV